MTSPVNAGTEAVGARKIERKHRLIKLGQNEMTDPTPEELKYFFGWNDALDAFEEQWQSRPCKYHSQRVDSPHKPTLEAAAAVRQIGNNKTAKTYPYP